MLDRSARAPLRTLSKANAELVARHLVMAGRLLDTDAEAAYAHAQAAMRRAGRVDVVREALAVTAYATGRYAEALRELRTVRRLSGIDAHRAMEADCERGLGRPERALAVVAATDLAAADEEDRVELAIVASGARADLGDHEAGLLVLESPMVAAVTAPELRQRLDRVRAVRLDELGRHAEAEVLRAAAGTEEEEELVVVHDLLDDVLDGDGRGEIDAETAAAEDQTPAAPGPALAAAEPAQRVKEGAPDGEGDLAPEPEGDGLPVPEGDGLPVPEGDGASVPEGGAVPDSETMDSKEHL